MTEVFKPIQGCPGYFVSNKGNVFSQRLHKEHGSKILKPHPDKDGYSLIGLCVNGKRVTKKVHRLVAQEFIPNSGNKPEINHKNGIKNDNRVENLEWCTSSENQTHKFRVLGWKSGRFGKRGSLCSLSKPIIQLKDGIVIAEYSAQAEASRHSGVNVSHIGECCRGTRKRAGGFEWAFKNLSS